MVYFGERRFKNAQAGVTSREKSRIVVPSLLLLALVLVILAQQWGSDEPGVPIRTQVEPGTLPVELAGGVADPAQGDPSEESEIDGAKARIQPPIEIPPFDTLIEPEPFLAMPQILSVVRDAEIADPGPPEIAGLIYLFHRFRAGVEVPVTDIDVEWRDLPQHSARLRGTRTEKGFVLIEEPIPRTLEPNRSGVLQYYEAFARDEGGHLVRLSFLEKPKILPADSEVFATVDFLRLHQYQMVRGGLGVVPEWVAFEVQKLEPLEFEGGDWSPLLYVMVISFGALGLLLVIVMRSKEPEQRRRTRRPRAAGGTRAPRPPTSETPPDPEAS